MKILALLALAAMLSGCVETHPVVYGVRGPAIQNEIYHPKADPLFKYWEDK